MSSSHSVSRIAGRPATQRPLRVLHLIDSLGHGGAEHQLSLLVRSFDPTAVDSYVCHIYPDAVLASEIKAAGVPVVALSTKPGRAALPRATARLIAIARAFEPDVIHTSLFDSDVLGGAVGNLLAIPVVTTLCSIWGQEQASNGVSRSLQLTASSAIWRATLRRAHTVIAISSAVRANAHAVFGLSPDRIPVIYRAIADTPGSSPPPATVRSQLGIAASQPVFLNVGRLVPSKGQIHLIRAMKSVLTALPNAMLLLAGEGWHRKALEDEIRALGIGQHVTLLGERHDIMSLVTMADVFVFPSLSEGLGVALLEAAGQGAACITTDIPPMTEIIDNEVSGLCVPPADPGALAAAMIRLGASPSLAAQFGREVAHRASLRFSLPAIVTAVEGVYESAAASSARRAPASRRDGKLN